MARVYDNYSSLIDFTRASSGTALRPVSYGDELVTNGTFDSDSDWTKDANWTIASGVATSTTSAGGIYQAITCEVGKIYFASIDITSAFSGGVVGVFQIRNSTNITSIASFAINDGTTGTKTVAFVATETTHLARVYVSGTAGAIDNISVKEVIFDQAGDPLTLFNHPTNIPRIEYDAEGNRLGLLVEESRTNLITHSNDFTDASWVKSNATVTKKTGITAPDGSEDVYHLQENSTNSVHQLKSSVSAGTQVFSVYAKGDGSGRYLKLFGYGLAVQDESPIFDIDNGIIYEPPTQTYFLSASIQNVGNGWYRCSLQADTDGGFGEAALAIVDSVDSHGAEAHTGDGASGFYIYGAQVEAGSFHTSYIPTSGATATRSADVASIATSAFGYNQSAGTVVVEGIPAAFDVDGRWFAISDGTVQNRIEFTTGPNYHPLVVDNGATQANLDAGGFTAGVFAKVGAVFATNNFAGVINGGTVATDSSGTVPTVDTLYIGGKANISVEQAMHIKSIKYYPRALTAAQIQELTS